MANRLAQEKSPYLLQHADNPVDWYPWGRDARLRAQAEDKPMLVSIGYSACHWCHVMAHESFEDPATAHLMNELFVNIKVDREERPDVDSVYMEAVQALAGQGGWPLNVFLTPDGRPFYGGTYFPPHPAHGRPSWRQVVESVARAYRERRDDVLHNAAALTDYVRAAQGRVGRETELSADTFEGAYSGIAAQFDWENGGFGGAPKFPQSPVLELLLRLWRRLEKSDALDFVRLTLKRLAEGGIHDQVGGGFHRYSVDAAWIVPHFEKMLYDNAMLARIYTLAYQATHEPAFRAVAESTLDYMLRELRSQHGGFFSAQDADSEGEEGKFYVWTPDELREALGEDADLAALRYGVTHRGNFEGKTILTVAKSVAEVADETGRTVGATEHALERARRRLLEVRAARVAPATDTKILTAWNALAIRSLAEAAWPLHRPDYLAAGRLAADFVLSEMRPGGPLVRSFRDGPSDIAGFLEDYAFLTEACISLYETTFDREYLATAEQLASELLDQFLDRSSGLLFDTPEDSEDLVVRPRSVFDNPIPSGSSAAALALLRLQAHTGSDRYADVALATIRSTGELPARAAPAVPYMLCAADFYVAGALQIAVLGDREAETEELLREVFDRFLPQRVLAVGEPSDTPLLSGRQRVGGRPTAFVCQDFACKLPVNERAALAAQLDGYAAS